MTGSRLRPRLGLRLRSEDGAILVFALIIVTTVALVVGTVLVRGDGSLRATVALREVAGSTYAADGAAQVAVNDLRTGHWGGTATEPADWAFDNSDDGTGCFGANTDADGDPANDAVGTLDLPNFYPASAASGDGPTSARVECVAEDSTGAQGSPVPITNQNKPGNAILTLGTGGETGLTSSASGGNSLRVHGGVWSNSDISVTNGDIVSSTSIRAHTGCAPTSALHAPVVDCSSGTVADPGYASDPSVSGTGVPPLRTPPTSCPAVVTFEPGYYDDAAALNNLTNRNACRDSVFWFRPGTYYFDFHNGTTDPMYDSDTNSGGGSEWNVSVGDLIAGDPVGDSLTNPRFPADGNCRNPIDDVSTQGVQFVFGGESRLRVDGGANVEICGSYHSDRPPIALYGLRTGTSTRTSLTEASGDDGDPLTTSGTPSVTPAGTDNTFTGATAAALRDAGNGSATWFRPSGGATAVSRTITMSGFAPPATIPKGSVVKEARLLVRHKASQNNAGTASTITLTPAGGSALGTFNLDRPGTLTTQTVDLRTQQPTVFNALQRAVYGNGYTGAKVDFTGTIARNLGAAATVELDAVRLELELYLPQFRAQTDAGLGAVNCLRLGGGCNLIGVGPSGGSYHGVFYVQGTTYTPTTRIQLNLSNLQQAEVFRFGVISRSLDFSTQGNPTFQDAVIQLPDNSPGWGFNGTLVQLKVFVCPDSPTCSPSPGRLALTTRVQLWDPSGSPTPGRRQVSVLSWSHTR